jgi:predicted MFS family arabinose efflux permease
MAEPLQALIPQSNSAADTYRRSGRVYMLVLLFAAAVLNATDRGIFAIAMPAIKHEYSFTDSQLGLLGGVAFGVFYAIASLPIGYLATRLPRRNLLAICLALWSAATTLTSLARGFISLFLARLSVGIGEAGGLPLSLSLIAARFEQTKRASATGWLNAGASLGLILGAWGTGALIAHFGWRTAFLVLGLPGALLALLLKITVSEPTDVAAVHSLPWRQLAQAYRDPALVQVTLAFIAGAFNAYGISAWTPSFYQRVLGMHTDEVGFFTGVVLGAGSLVGSLAAGFVVDRIGRGRTAFGLNMAAWVVLATVPMGIWGFMTRDRVLSLSLVTATQIAGGMRNIVTYTAVQNLTTAALRPFIIAITASLTLLIGSGLGPLCVGEISDHTAGGVATGLAVMSAAPLWFVVHCWWASALERRRDLGKPPRP